MQFSRLLAVFALVVPLGGCQSAAVSPGGPDAQTNTDSGPAVADASADATTPVGDASPPPTVTIASNAADAGILGIAVAPLALVPSFSPAVTDYYVR